MAYGVRISDWSSDVSSSDLGAFALTPIRGVELQCRPSTSLCFFFVARCGGRIWPFSLPPPLDISGQCRHRPAISCISLLHSFGARPPRLLVRLYRTGQRRGETQQAASRKSYLERKRTLLNSRH